MTDGLAAGSPAINAGDSTNAPSTDQRGFARVGTPDIGAFEFGGKSQGVVYDAASDFSVASNPNGVWSYGYENPLGSGFQLYNATVTNPYRCNRVGTVVQSCTVRKLHADGWLQHDIV